MTLLDSEETWRKPRYQRTLRVHYPPEAGDVLLHLGGHEDRLLEPTRKGQGGACCEFDLVANGGGAGTWRGGLPFRRTYELLQDAIVTRRYDRARMPPLGRCDALSCAQQT